MNSTRKHHITLVLIIVFSPPPADTCHPVPYLRYASYTPDSWSVDRNITYTCDIGYRFSDGLLRRGSRCSETHWDHAGQCRRMLSLTLSFSITSLRVICLGVNGDYRVGLIIVIVAGVENRRGRPRTLGRLSYISRFVIKIYNDILIDYFR